MDFSNEENIKILIHSYLSDQISIKDNESLLSWINQSDNNKMLFLKYCRVWSLTSQVESTGKFDKAENDEWEKLSEKLSGSDNEVSTFKITSLQLFIRIAAVFLLFISIGTTIAWQATSKRLKSFTNQEIINQINVPKGSRSEVILPDGTKVTLNAGSNLSYSGSFGLTHRNVILKGEGYFDVVTNPGIPFIVEAFDLKIKAFGTIFNVKAYPEENLITTTLVEGIVRIEGEGIDITMTPRQKVTCINRDEKRLLPVEANYRQLAEKENTTEAQKTAEAPKVNIETNVDANEYIAWKDGRLVFNTEKLSTLVVLLERKFNMSVIIESEELLNYKFTGTFHQETLEQILDIIKLSAPMEYKIGKGVVYIQLDDKRKAIFQELSNREILNY